MTVPPLRLLCDVLLDFGDVRRMSSAASRWSSASGCAGWRAGWPGCMGMIMINVGDQRLARSFFRTARAAARRDRRPAAPGLDGGAGGTRPALLRRPRRGGRAGPGRGGPGPAATCAWPRRWPPSWRPGRWPGWRRGARHARPRGCGAIRPCWRPPRRCRRLPATDRATPRSGTPAPAAVPRGRHAGHARPSEGAEKALTLALRLYSTEEILDRSLTRLGLARCRLEADEPEEALRLGQETLFAVPREHRSEIMMRGAGRWATPWPCATVSSARCASTGRRSQRRRGGACGGVPAAGSDGAGPEWRPVLTVAGCGGRAAGTRRA